jgi:acetoacetyl-CoA reductase
VNNAGINRDKSFLKMTGAMWDEVMRVNLDGVFNTTQLVAQEMVGSGWGTVSGGLIWPDWPTRGSRVLLSRR